jgi:hypothetical protein
MKPNSSNRFLSHVTIAGMIGVSLLLLAGCSPPSGDTYPGAGSNPPNAGATAQAMTPLATPSNSASKPATAAPSPTPGITPSRSPAPSVIGPSRYPPGVNPLTGLPVDDLDNLSLAPILVSVTNFPPSARPQAGLSIAAHVWETSIGQGMTRFLAVYYGDYQDEFEKLSGSDALQNPYDFIIGPVRSGRIGFEEIKGMYPSARLLIRYASPEVIGRLSNWGLVTASNFEDINSAGITLEELRSLPLPRVDPGEEGGLAFSEQVPIRASSALELDIFYNIYNRVRWQYSSELGQYLRFQDPSDGSEELNPVLDRLTAEQIGFENVIVLWAYHRFENIQGTILELGLMYMPDGFGLLYRDGRVQQIHWSTRSGRLSIHDEDGDPLPLKPGRTFFEVVSNLSTWDADTGFIRFYSPPVPTATATMTPTPTATWTPEPAEDTPDPAVNP